MLRPTLGPTLGSAPGTPWGRLGFPSVGPHRRLVTAIGIDAVGSGLWIPLSVLYFLGTTTVGLTRIGAAMSVGALVAIPLTLVAGSVVDRYGARRVFRAGNLLQAAGFGLYLTAATPVAIALVVGVTAVGRTLMMGSFGPMVAEVSERGERESWFGMLASMRNVGFALGGLLATAALTVRTPTVLRAVVVANAITFLVAFVLVRAEARTRDPVAPPPSPRTPRTLPEAGWRQVLTDPGYRWLVGANLGFALGSLALTVVFPAYVVERLGLPGWVAGAGYVLNTVMVGLGQGLVIRALGGTRRWVAVVGAAGFMVAGFGMLDLAGAGVALVVAIGVVLAAYVVYTLGEMTGGPVLAAMAAEAPPELLRGRYQAAFQMSWSAAAVIAPALFLGLLDRGHLALWGGLSALVVLGAACGIGLRHRMPLARGRIGQAPVEAGAGPG